jgi:multiple sugar transport system substrate-binding protein
LPLDPLIAKSAFDLAPFGEVPEQLRVRGRLFEMPFLADPYVIAYNRDLFAAAGLPLPAPGWTWDELRADAAKLTHGAGKEKVWGLTTGGGMLPGLAVSWFEERAPGVWRSDESALREGLQFLTGLVAEGITPADSHARAPRPLYFGWGESALEYNTYGNLRQQTEGTKIDWGVVPLPTRGAPPRSLSGGFYETLSISAKSVRPEAAWKFIAFACGPKGARLMAARGRVPFYRSPEVAQAATEAAPPPPAGSHLLFDLPISVAGHGRPLTEAESLAYDLIFESLSAQRPWEEALANYLQTRSQIK